MKRTSTLIIIALSVIYNFANAQVVPVGSGSYNLTFPQPDLAKYPGSLGYPNVGVNPGGNMDDGTPWGAVPQGVFNATEMYANVGGSNNPPKYVAGSFDPTKTRYPTKQQRSYSGPFQSHEWYSSASWNFEDTSGVQRQAGMYKYRHFSRGMHPHPLNVMARNRGMVVKCNQVINTPGLVAGNGPRIDEFGAPVGQSGANFNYFQSDGIAIGLQGMDIPLMRGTKVSAHGDWSATIEFEHQNGQDKLLATTGRGIPYVFFERQGPNKLPVSLLFPGVAYVYRVTANGSIALRVNIDGGRYQWFGLFFEPNATMDKLSAGVAPGNFLVRNLTSPGTPFNPRPPGNPYWQPTYAVDGLGRQGTAAELAEGLGTVWQFSLPNTNYFSVAALPDSTLATFMDFENHAYNFVTDSKVSYSYDECTALLTTTFDATITNHGPSSDPNNTIMGLYPHQWKHTPVANPINTSYVFGTPRGAMKMARTKSFSTQMYFKGLIPYMPGVNNVPLSPPQGSYSDANLTTYLNNFMGQPQWINSALNNVYGFSKKIEHVNDLVSIAFQLNHPRKNELLDTLKVELQKWFTAPAGDNYKMFHYDPVWNALCGYPSAFDAAPALNDQHFHYGPYVKAAATIAKFDKAWAANYKGMVEMVIKAADNWDRSDTRFQYLRYFDPYAGHSWAGGHGNSDKGLNQESSSEALNFAAGVMLWGEQTGDAATRDLGILLYLTESEASKLYYFDVDGDTHPNTAVAYGIEPNKNHAATYTPAHIGILWDAGADYATYFSADPEQIHAIHYLPVSSTSVYWGHKSGSIAKNNFDEMIANNGGTINSSYWEDLFPKLISLYDADKAIADWNASAKGGETAHTFGFIHSMFTLGKVVDNIYADVAGYNVFEKNGCKHYVVYNPKGAFQKSKVTFTDGNCFLLPEGDSLYVFTKCPEPLQPDSIYVICPGSTVELTAKDTLCSTNFKWDRNNVLIPGATNKSYEASLAGTYHVSYNISNCIEKKDSFIVQLKDTLDIININRTCNAGGTAYTLTFDISGGDAASYSVLVNGTGAGGPGTLSGNQFTSGLITSGAAYSYIVKDKNGCDPDTISGSRTCSCITSAGTMNITPVNFCDTAKAIAFHNGDQALDANDTLIYYLHSGNGPTLGTPYATGNAPLFGYTGGLSYGTTYYISAVAGNKNGSGGIDLTDLCLSVAPGTPVVFNSNPVVSLGTDTALCQAASMVLDAGTGASYAWSTNETTKQITVNAAGAYSVTLTDSKGCENSDTLIVSSVSAPTVSNLTETCNGIVNYTVTFDMTGGDAASYQVLVDGAGPGGPGTLSGNTFTSAAIPSGTAYSFTVKDKNSCTPNTLAGVKNCNCQTSSGAMNATAINVCENTAATVAAAVNPDLDADDVLVYYLHNNPGTSLGTIYGTNTVPSFNYAPPLVFGTTYYISAVAGNNNGSGGIDATDPCLSVAKGTPIVFNALPTVSNAGTDKTVCGATTSLSGNTVTTGIGVWSVSAGSGTATAPTSAISGVTGLSAGSNTFMWTIISGSCPPSTSSVTITSEVPPSPSVAGIDQKICTSTAILDANAPATGTGAWSLAGGSGTVIIPTDPKSGVAGLSVGTNTFEWTISNGTCTDSKSSVDIVVDENPSVADAGLPQSLCGSTATLSGTTPVTGTGTWSLTSGTGSASTPSSPSSGVTGLSIGTNIFTWSIANGTCPASSSNVSIDVLPPPTPSEAGLPQVLCNATTAALNANTPVNGTGVWTVAAGTGNVLSPTDPNSVVAALSPGVNTFRWTISNATCTSTDTVNIVIEQLPDKANAGGDQEICDATTTLNGNNPAIGKGKWSVVSGTMNITNPDAAITTGTGLVNGSSYTLRWTISNGSCPADADEVTIKVQDLPKVNLGKDSTICTSDTVRIVAGGFGKSFLWQDGSIASDFYVTTPGMYHVTVTQNQCFASDTINFVLNCPFSLYIPNSFTPNNDADNDVFKVYGENIEEFEMSIHNRWGECFFVSSDVSKGWDGKTPAGMDAQIDVYVYSILYAPVVNGKTLRKKLRVGAVSLIR